MAVLGIVGGVGGGGMVEFKRTMTLKSGRHVSSFDRSGDVNEKLDNWKAGRIRIGRLMIMPQNGKGCI